MFELSAREVVVIPMPEIFLLDPPLPILPTEIYWISVEQERMYEARLPISITVLLQPVDPTGSPSRTYKRDELNELSKLSIVPIQWNGTRFLFALHSDRGGV